MAYPERKTSLIGLSDENRIAGESHPHARLSDNDVEWMRFLHDEGFVGYRTLALAFGVPRATVQGICTYYRRSVEVVRVIRRK